jgi:hypothetical protein
MRTATVCLAAASLTSSFGFSFQPLLSHPHRSRLARCSSSDPSSSSSSSSSEEEEYQARLRAISAGNSPSRGREAEEEEDRKGGEEDEAEPEAPVRLLDVVLTHTMADFDALASAVGLAKVWAADWKALEEEQGAGARVGGGGSGGSSSGSSGSSNEVCVVMPRGAHPVVAEFLALHKHLFPIRSLKEVTAEAKKGAAAVAANTAAATGGVSGGGGGGGGVVLNRVALVDCQRRDRVGPASGLLDLAREVHVIDHHADKESDVGAAPEHVKVEHVGSVSTIVTEMLMERAAKDSEGEGLGDGETDGREDKWGSVEGSEGGEQRPMGGSGSGSGSGSAGSSHHQDKHQHQHQHQDQHQDQHQHQHQQEHGEKTAKKGVVRLTDAEATLMALGVHADTGSLTYDSATGRDGASLAWLMERGASQVAINEYSKGGLSEVQRAALLDAFASLRTVEHRVSRVAVNE